MKQMNRSQFVTGSNLRTKIFNAYFLEDFGSAWI